METTRVRCPHPACYGKGYYRNSEPGGTPFIKCEKCHGTGEIVQNLSKPSLFLGYRVPKTRRRSSGTC